jgi:hypothetical protein
MPGYRVIRFFWDASIAALEPAKFKGQIRLGVAALMAGVAKQDDSKQVLAPPAPWMVRL